MLKKMYRGLSPAEVSEIIAAGSTLSSHYFRLFYGLRTPSCTRFAIVLAKQIKVNAVERNRIRRRVYAGLEQSRFDMSRPLNIVVLVKSSCLHLKSDDFLRRLREVLGKVM